MNPLTLPCTTTLLLILYLTSQTTTTATDTTVYDVYGEPLESGLPYYIIPFKRGGGSGLQKILKGNFLCPSYYVGQTDKQADFGSPVTITPQNANQGSIITLSSNINIQFNDFKPAGLICLFFQSGVWKLATDTATGYLYVELDGQKGSTDSLFQIEEDTPEGYKLVYKPSDASGDIVSGNLGISYASVGRVLSLNDTNPLTVAFEPAY